MSPDPEWVDVGINTPPGLLWWLTAVVSVAVVSLLGAALASWLKHAEWLR